MARFVVCLDGTWNNAAREIERKDGAKVYRPSNVLKIARGAELRGADNASQIIYYDTGVGSMNRAPSGAARFVRGVDNVLGGALGTGFEINIEEAYTFLANNWSKDDELFVFGFSRGAAQARSLCRLIEWVGGFPVKSDAYYIPRLYTAYLEQHGEGSGAQIWQALNERRRNNPKKYRSLLSPIEPATIRFLGVWDTVLALDSRFRMRWQKRPKSISFHTPSVPPQNVERIRHALAIDEARHDFRPEIFGSSARDMEQRWFAGVHSNVGGGLKTDGLANCALHWLVDEAAACGLEVDADFLSYYRRFERGEASSKATAFKILDAALWAVRGSKGERDLLARPDMTLDPSVFVRLNTDLAGDSNKMDGPYRPKNLLRYLAKHPELHNQLSDDVKRAVAKAK